MTRHTALSRTLAATFEAIKEHAKSSPHEADLLYAAIAAHLRSAAPLALAALPDPVLAPATTGLPLHLDLRDGSIDLSRTEDGRLLLYVADVSGHDSAVTVTLAQLELLVSAAMAVKEAA